MKEINLRDYYPFFSKKMVCNKHNTPGIIKYPFWQMTAQNSKAIYACINLDDLSYPAQIQNQTIAIRADMADIIKILSCSLCVN